MGDEGRWLTDCEGLRVKRIGPLRIFVNGIPQDAVRDYDDVGLLVREVLYDPGQYQPEPWAWLHDSTLVGSGPDPDGRDPAHIVPVIYLYAAGCRVTRVWRSKDALTLAASAPYFLAERREEFSDARATYNRALALHMNCILPKDEYLEHSEIIRLHTVSNLAALAQLAADLPP